MNPKFIRNYALLDRLPFPYFRLFEIVYNGVSGKLERVELDLATDYAGPGFVKFSARHEKNQLDFNDHTLDDIYLPMTFDTGGICHYEWAADDIDRLGKWYVVLHLKTVGGLEYHSQTIWYFNCIPKAPFGSFGAIT